MVLPIAIPAAVAVAAAAGAIATLVRQRSTGQLAILGGPQVGKTTLLQTLSGSELQATPEPTTNPAVGGVVTLESGGTTRKLRVSRDLPGVDGLGYPSWKKAFDSADFVLYVFRADHVARGESGEVHRVKNDLGRLANWMKARGNKAPKILLVATWADADPEFLAHPAVFARTIAAVPEIRTAAAKLNNAELVVGALQNETSADKLRTNISGRLL